jgi:hypothetical protein
MRSTEKAIRNCIDSFADDLIELAEKFVRDHVATALARIKTPPPSRRRVKEAAKTEARPGRRKLTTVEKLERQRARAEERKRQRQLALPFAGDAAADAAPKGRRGRRKGSEQASENAATPADAPPPPLFVVKRTRDGNIQTLQRKAEEAAQQAAQQAGENAPAS